jgi:hypothetical protein
MVPRGYNHNIGALSAALRFQMKPPSRQSQFHNAIESMRYNKAGWHAPCFHGLRV